MRTNKLSAWGLAISGAILLAATGCAPSTPPPNVLLITLDTTRADRLGCYGYEQAETPTLDALAAGGVMFANAHAQVPLTLPSHTGMLTGTYARSNGIHVNGGARLGERFPELAIEPCGGGLDLLEALEAHLLLEDPARKLP